MDWIADGVAALALVVSFVALVLNVRSRQTVEWELTDSSMIKRDDGDYLWTLVITNRGGTTAEHVFAVVPGSNGEPKAAIGCTMDGPGRALSTDDSITAGSLMAARDVQRFLEGEGYWGLLSIGVMWRAFPRRRRVKTKWFNARPSDFRGAFGPLSASTQPGRSQASGSASGAGSG